MIRLTAVSRLVGHMLRYGSLPTNDYLSATVFALGTLVVSCSIIDKTQAEELPVVDVEGQPLAANTKRLIDALNYLGRPLPKKTQTTLKIAIKNQDAMRIQQIMDQYVLLLVSLNPEVRVKVKRGPAAAVLQQGGFAPVVVKVVNQSRVTRQLQVDSPQSGPVYSGAALSILRRQAQTELNDNDNIEQAKDRFLQVEMFRDPPMTKSLSGLDVEYTIALLYSSESGRREAMIRFHVGEGTQDIGFRGETPVLFTCRPAVPVQLQIRDHDGTPTTSRLTFRDKLGHVYPPQAKRLAPDFFFQPQIYRKDGDVVLLPPGKLKLTFSRGPEYRTQQTEVVVPQVDASSKRGTKSRQAKIEVPLTRWVDPMSFGFYCGDHHIHGAGCSHYSSPTEGVTPKDMFLQVKGEGLNVGCVLTWGPCFDSQRQFFSPKADRISEDKTILKYDLEISGFGSAALGHVCLLNLKDQTYPGSQGTRTKGWPTWTVPVMRWCKEQGGVTGYPHPAMHVNPKANAARMIRARDKDRDDALSRAEAAGQLLPYRFAVIDTDRNGSLSRRELQQSLDHAADQLPNLAVPEMNGAGAMEIFVSAAEGVCDVISAMDTARIPEWNTWYHLMNCGLPIKLSGETDFPCMSGRRVGQGRVYVQLGMIDKLDFSQWCRGVAAGQSYVSDGFAHALHFSVNGKTPGTKDVRLSSADKKGQQQHMVEVVAKVAFAPETPKAVAYGLLNPGGGRRMVGDTINLHAPRSNATVRGSKRQVDIVVNGIQVVSTYVPADGKVHELRFKVPIKDSSWVALRQFPQLHTNPVNVLIDGKPIRASENSARWCIEAIKLLWNNRHRMIASTERVQAKKTYDKAIAFYQRIASEAR